METSPVSPIPHVAVHGDRPSPSSSDEEHRVRAAYARRPREDARYAWTNQARVLAIQERERQMLALLSRHAYLPLGERTILEVGCGTGFWLREFVKWGARPENVSGIDLLEPRIAEARHLCPPGVRIECGSAADLPYAGGQFDLVLQSLLFTSVLSRDVKRRIASEMLRVVKPDGLIVWYDFHVNNPRNADVRGVGKREIREIFPHCRVELRRIGLAPPIARAVAPYSWVAASLLAALPMLRTHYLGTIRKLSSA